MRAGIPDAAIIHTLCVKTAAECWPKNRKKENPMKYDFDTVTDRLGTCAIKYDLAEKRGAPKDAVSLWVADMDFPAAPCIRDAINERARHGIFGYSRPDSRYYAALKSWFKSRHNFEISDEWVVNTPGVVFALAAAIRAFTREGDAVLIQKPVYYPFFQTIEAQNRRVVSSPLVFENGKYRIDFEDFERKIVSENVRLFLFCSPHNPGGRVWRREEISRLSEICLAHNVLVVSDEIHCDILFGGNTHTVYASVSGQAAQNSIVCTSPSKTFNLAGLQFSNIIIPSPDLRREFLAEMDRAGYCEPSLFGVIAAEAAYREGGEWFDQALGYIWQNILFAEKYIGENCPKIKVHKPEGTYLLWLDFSGFDLSDSEISGLILNRAKVWLDRGAMFGKEGEKFQRVNCATPRSVLEKALSSICAVFKNL